MGNPVSPVYGLKNCALPISKVSFAVACAPDSNVRLLGHFLDTFCVPRCSEVSRLELRSRSFFDRVSEVYWPHHQSVSGWANLVNLFFCNQQVVGSNPTAGSLNFPF
jgi:hypothetical protein